jgi:hypothetical protein
MPIQIELREEMDTLINDVNESVVFLRDLFESYVTKQEKVREAAEEVSHCILEIYKHLKRVSTNDSLPSPSLAEKMLSSLFKDTNMKYNKEKKIFLQFLEWLKGILVLCVSSTIEIKEIKEELNLLREDGKKLKNYKTKYQQSCKPAQKSLLEEIKRENDVLSIEKNKSMFGESIILRDLSKEEIDDIDSGKLTKEDEIWVTGMIETLKRTPEYQEVQKASVEDLKKWYARLDEAYTSNLRLKGSRVAASWVLKMFAMGGYQDVAEHVMDSFENDKAEEIVKAAMTGLLLEDKRLKWK